MPDGTDIATGDQYAQNVSRLNTAYEAWQSAPVEEVTNSGVLFQAANSLISVQTQIVPLIDAYRASGVPATPPLDHPDWYDGFNFLINREQRTSECSIRWFAKGGINGQLVIC